MIEKSIKELVFYAQKHLGLREDDVPYLTNLLLNHFEKDAPYEGTIDEKAISALTVPDVLVDALVAYDIETRKLDEGAAERDASWVMGLLSPLPSQVDDAFYAFYEVSPKAATDYLYDLSIKNNYVAKTRIDKNLVWMASFKEGSPLEISINLSKPEKNNKDIAKLVHAAPTGYPKCLLCLENLGYQGRDNHPARENIRFVPLTLNEEKWYLQYSPYGYYHEHCIVFYEKHTPMSICLENLRALLDFVELFPHYFIGSNSDLPIVGGSILNHEHFQGGEHLLPLLKAPIKETILTSPKGTKVSIVDFYVSALRIEGKDRRDVESYADKILTTWKTYDDPENEILSSTSGERHNTLTPFARYVDGRYVLTLCLRNNRTSERYPDGIFHAHPEYHAIKKEGIGLIEAAGLFILPARLLRQEKEVDEAVAKNLTESDYLALYPDLAPFKSMIETMKAEKITSREYINRTCQSILKNVAVFKDDEQGQKGLHQFLKEALK